MTLDIECGERKMESDAGAPHHFEILECRRTFAGDLVLDNMGRFMTGRSVNWFPPLDIHHHLHPRKPS